MLIKLFDQLTEEIVMFRSFLIILVLSWIFFAGCQKKQPETMEKSKGTTESVTDSSTTDTTSTMDEESAEPEDPNEE
jgi:uncharacterized lipoprotein YajG